MKTHTFLKSVVAALALTSIPNLSAQTGCVVVNREVKFTGLDAMNVSICYEAFSLPIAKAGELQRKGMTDEELYKEVVNTGKLERVLVLRTKSGQRSVLENTTYYIYPTEFMMPEIPTPRKRSISLPIAATAYEKKEVGDTFEAEPTLSSDAKSVDMQFSVSHVALARREKWGQGVAEVEQPQLETQKVTTNITASVGSPRLVGTLNPVFGNGLTARTEQNVWFCFITAAVAQNNTVPQKKSAR